MPESTDGHINEEGNLIQRNSYFYKDPFYNSVPYGYPKSVDPFTNPWQNNVWGNQQTILEQEVRELRKKIESLESAIKKLANPIPSKILRPTSEEIEKYGK